MSDDYRAKWLQIIRDGGDHTVSGWNSTAWRFLGGDVVDVVQLDGTTSLWLLLDYLIGNPGAVESDDTFADVSFPFLFRNGVVAETPAGTMAGQIFRSGSNFWLDPQQDGGLAADKVWWPTGGVNPALSGGSGTVIVAHQLDNGGTELEANYGIEATVFVSLGAFGTYASHVTNTTFGPDHNVWPSSFRHDPDAAVGDTVYVSCATLDTSATSIPNIVAAPPGRRRLARVATGSVTTFSAWEFWDGTGWSADPADSDTIRDVSGEDRLGITGNPVKLDTGHWLNVGRTNAADPFLDVWQADEIQGPWQRIARVPLAPQSSGAARQVRVGGSFLPGVTHLSHHATIVPHLSSLVPDGYQVAVCTTTNLGGEALDAQRDDVPIGAHCPLFVVVPEM